MSLTRKRLLEARVRECGGRIAETFGGEVTHLVVGMQLPRTGLHFEAGGCFKVTDSWLCESLLLGKRLPEQRYLWRPLSEEEQTSQAQGVVKEEASQTKRSSRKRRREEGKEPNPELRSDLSLADFRAKIVEEFRTCAAAWAVRGDKWRSWQYKKAENLVAQARGRLDAEELRRLGLTPKFVEKCREIQKTGCLEQAEAFRKDGDIHALLEMTRIHGVGPALAQAWLRCGVRCIADVRQRADTLPGTASGPATGLTKVQRLGLRFVEDFQVPISRSEVERICATVIQRAEASGQSSRLVPCGAYRRGDVLCSGVTLVVSFPGDGPVVTDAGSYLQAMEGIVVADLSGASIAAPTRVPGDDDPALSAQACLCVVRGSPSEAEPMRYRRCDFVFCRDASLPFVTLQWTGSDGGLFNREMKRIAALRGLHLSNTYICKADRTAQGRQVGEITRAGAKILCKDEREIFEMLGLPYRPPERREVDAELLEAVEEAARQAPEALRLVKMELAS